jgi:hypothetical protein
VEAGRRHSAGYHRPRAVPCTPNIAFTVQDYAFETDWRDLWVTPPATDPLDRIKVSRTAASRSAHRGYPPQLFRTNQPMNEESARSMAVFWLAWKDTAEAAGHPPVRLDRHRRGLELNSRHDLQET